MVSVCDRCSNTSVIFLRYSGQHLCSEHFIDLLRRRVRKEARCQKVLQNRSKIGIALSGGKDSLLAMKMMFEIIEPIRDREIIAVTIDEGISGYRPSSVKISEKITNEMGIRWEILSFKELFGMELDVMVKRSGLGPCTICGILRRQALNKASQKIEASVLVTGHNLDDMAQTVLMNVMSADVQRFARLGPHLQPLPGFVPRAMILRTTPEVETYLAAHLLKLPIHDVECPYSDVAQRGLFRDILLKAERESPGTRHSILNFHEKVSSFIPKTSALNSTCPRCSEPMAGGKHNGLCKACDLLNDLGVSG